jgi:hypothetical protein
MCLYKGCLMDQVGCLEQGIKNNDDYKVSLKYTLFGFQLYTEPTTAQHKSVKDLL